LLCAAVVTRTRKTRLLLLLLLLWAKDNVLERHCSSRFTLSVSYST
jgi:hypothetical protein